MFAANLQPKRSASRGGHRRRHTKFPPQEYSDFTRTDLSLVAPILLPQTAHDKRSAYEKRTKKSIADLPPHLHCKLPLLSSFCGLHDKLSPGPVTSLFNSLREEIEDEVPRTWGPLVEQQQLSSQKREMVEIVQHLAVLWLGPKVFQARFGREPRRVFMKEKPTKCCACTLVAMAGDFQTQVVMAALFIGRIRQEMWENSKRIVWYLEWTSARLPKSRRDDAKHLIWEIGKKFRMTRLGAEGTGKSKKKANLEAEEESELGPGTASYVFSLDRELREERSKGPRKLIGSKPQGSNQQGLAKRNNASEEDDVELAIQRSLKEQEDQVDDTYGNYRRPRASSYYSNTESGERPPSISIAKDIDGIIDLYEGSLIPNNNPEDDDWSFAPSQDAGDTEPQPSGQYNMTPSRIQSMLDNSFGGPWDGPRIGKR